jgi:aminocarboxymuconate-semialdehyde decarboxylase
VDVHAHHLGRELATSIGGDPEAPRLVVDDEVSGRIICGEQIFRKVGSMLWFWAACETEGAAVFVHPIRGGQGVVRRAGQPYDLGLGMLTDTAIAASSLVFGGVLERYPGLRIALAHGCGAFPWAYPRLAVAAHLAAGGDTADWDVLTRCLYADSLVFDDEHLRLLVHRFGADRILLGSDAPFFPDQMTKSMHQIDRARKAGCVPAHVDHGLLARNALEFLALTG